MFLKNLKTENQFNRLKNSLGKIRKIPIPIAFLLTIFGLLGGIFLINNSQTIFSKAQSEKSPLQIKVTNIDSSSFVVSWITQTEATGIVSYGKTASTDELQKDIRDINSAEMGKYLTHFVLIENLQPKTKYFFNIISEDKSYNQSGKPYEVTTALEKALPASDIAQGKILTANSLPAIGAIVYVSLPNGITQASLVEENGYWMILLSRTRANDLQSYLNYNQSSQIEEISVQNGQETASASLTTGNDNPAPNIMLGKTYDFIKNPNTPTPTPAINQNSFPETSGSSGFQSAGQTNEVIITYPAENEKINSQIPEFFGAGPQDKILDILVESEEKIIDKTEVDQNGQWKWSPENTLSPGEHTITVTYIDQEGFVKKATRNFYVYAAETNNLPSFTATASGNKTTPTPTPTKIVSATPTISPTATISGSLKTTPTPTPKTERTTIPSGEQPTSGNSLPTWAFLSGGILLVIIGSIFLLL